MINSGHINLFALSFILLLSSHTFFTAINGSNAGVDGEHLFTYLEGAGKGPKEWGHIKSEWQVCEAGKLQSPINLFDKKVQIAPDLGKLNMQYKPAPATLKNRGHDISIQWKSDAGKITINGTDYNLVQCHWHSPTEHTLNGNRYDMELHLVHKSSLGQIAALGILYKFGYPDPFLTKFINHVKQAEEEGIDLGEINPDDIRSGTSSYYRYIGSLTAPPCTEGVIWTVLKKVRTVSMEQVWVLRDAVVDEFKENARPNQKLEGRPVFFYDSEGN